MAEPPFKQAKHSDDDVAKSRDESLISRLEVLDRLEQMLRTSIAALERKEPSATDLHLWALLIYNSMTTPGRVYHSVHHIFDVAANLDWTKDAILVLAALFHDVIYLTIDQELSEEQQRILSDVVRHTHNKHSVEFKYPIVDPMVQMVRSMFGYVLGRPQLCRHIDEINEYLSAVVAVKVLSNTVCKKHLFQLSACIEASIPFRPVEDGNSALESLHERLKLTNVECSVGLSEAELIETTQQAARFANCDLGSFYSNDRLLFLDNGWKLLPEWKPQLLSPTTCTLQEFYQALVLMKERYRQIHVDTLFESFRGQPNQVQLQEMRQKACDNLNVVAQYVGARLLAIEVLIDMMVIAIGKEGYRHATRHISTFSFLRNIDQAMEPWAEPTYTPPAGWNPEIHHLLYQGRRQGFDWDPAKASLSAFLYATMGSPASQVGRDATEGDGALLDKVPPAIVQELAPVLAKELPAYASKLLALPKKLGLDEDGETVEE